MNMNKTIANVRKVGGDYFRLMYLRKSNLYLKDYINKFNFDDYWCFKATNHQKLIDEEDFLKFEYSCYVFFKKELYDVNKIIEWTDWIKVNSVQNGNGGGYLVIPTPPFNPKKVIIKQ